MTDLLQRLENSHGAWNRVWVGRHDVRNRHLVGVLPLGQHAVEHVLLREDARKAAVVHHQHLPRTRPGDVGLRPRRREINRVCCASESAVNEGKGGPSTSIISAWLETVDDVDLLRVANSRQHGSPRCVMGHQQQNHRDVYRWHQDGVTAPRQTMVHCIKHHMPAVRLCRIKQEDGHYVRPTHFYMYKDYETAAVPLDRGQTGQVGQEQTYPPQQKPTVRHAKTQLISRL